MRQVPKFNKSVSNIPVVGMELCVVFVVDAINNVIKILLYIIIYILLYIIIYFYYIL